jgi:hypothetical protein
MLILLPMAWINFFPDETIFFVLKFWASLKFEVTPSLGPVDASRNPKLAFSFAMNKNTLKELFRILKKKHASFLGFIVLV